MQKMTLLSMVQNILSAMDSDEVNSISDTVESLQVAEVIRETYYEQFNNIIIPEFNGLIKLEGLGDIDHPNYLRIPEEVSDVDWIRYLDTGNQNRYKELRYLRPEDFLERYLQYTGANVNIMYVEDFSGMGYYIKTNAAPTTYTIFDDRHIVMDSYDSEVESTLHADKSIAFGTTIPSFPLVDTFIPNLDGNLFPLLLAEAKSTCFINFKQISSTKEEQRARRQRIRMQNNQYKSKIQQGTRKEWNFARNRW